MPVTTRARAKHRVAPYTAPPRKPSIMKRKTSHPPSPSLPAVEQVPTSTRRPKAVRKFRWAWTAERKLLVNLLGVRLPLSEAACIRLADLFNGLSPQDVRARVELLQGQRDVTLVEDAEAAGLTAPTEEAVETHQPAVEEVDFVDLGWSDTSSLSSIRSNLSEFEDDRSPTLRPFEAPDNGSSTAPSSTSSTPTSGLLISSSQQTTGLQPILADGRPLKPILKTSRGRSGARVAFDLRRTKFHKYEWEYEMVLPPYARESARSSWQDRPWVPVENADWEQPLLKRKAKDGDNSQSPATKKVCTAGHAFHKEPTEKPRAYPGCQSTFPWPARTIAAATAGQEWQDSDVEIPFLMGRRSVMDYPLHYGRHQAFLSPRQYPDFESNTPNANPAFYRTVSTAEQEEEAALKSKLEANAYRPSLEDLREVGHTGRRDASPDPAPTTMRAPTPPPPETSLGEAYRVVGDAFRSLDQEGRDRWMDILREQMEQERAEKARHAAERDQAEDPGDRKYFNQYQ
ncbi:uncharacterized protein IWZ02DRAFT_508839 [Phyllosticta citriasiana]|uniref:uncharacterized protein n=1 Tax=Phyllosticta citriasiana TaxID=595635 RepID=UPI0030FD8029